MEYKVCKQANCPHNGQMQSIDQFNKDSSRHDGYHPYCKTCRSIRAKERMKNPNARESARKASEKYRMSEKGKEYIQQYYKEHKSDYRERDRKYHQTPIGRAKSAEKQVAYRLRNKHKEKARAVAKYAISTDKIPKPSHCEWCGKPAGAEELEAHHWLGYKKQNWLNVRFVHKHCHVICENAAPDEWP